MQPSLMPFTPEDFDLVRGARPRGMFPALAGRMRPSRPRALDERDVLVHARRGLDRRRERDASAALWVCEAVWVTHGGGMARQVAEWMVNGEPSYDLAEADANRFYPFQTTRAVRDRARASSSTARSTTSCIRCQQPAKPREAAADAVLRRGTWSSARSCFTGAGWERPQWFEANRDAASAA